ncbi:MAG: hypothetical protein HDS35_00890 [Bacteroides sp.]|nr:hypothetical protein [Bacteroides sp.]
MKHLKQEFDKLSFKDALAYSMAYLSLIVGFVLLFIGMFTDPKGQIHESVLTAFGIILVFVGAILQISLYWANQLSQMKGTLPGLIREILRTDSPETSINLDKKEETKCLDTTTAR